MHKTNKIARNKIKQAHFFYSILFFLTCYNLRRKRGMCVYTCYYYNNNIIFRKQILDYCLITNDYVCSTR